MSLTESRRYLLADGVERWRDAQLDAVAAALGDLPPDLTVVLIARGKAPAKLAKAVKAAGGEIHEFEAPQRARDAAGAGRRGAAARLPARAGRGAACWSTGWGPSPLRLHNELERLALWAGRGGRGQAPPTSTRWSPTPPRRRSGRSPTPCSSATPRRRCAIAERLISQGENVTGLIYGLASRLRKACAAAAQLEEGMPPKQVESGLGMHPYAAKQLVAPARQDATVDDLREATIALADLEVWCRGGADYGDELALTLALRRAAAGVGGLTTCAGGDAGGAGLLAGAGVAVHGALLDGLVDAGDQGAVLGLDRARHRHPRPRSRAGGSGS